MHSTVSAPANLRTRCFRRLDLRYLVDHLLEVSRLLSCKLNLPLFLEDLGPQVLNRLNHGDLTGLIQVIPHSFEFPFLVLDREIELSHLCLEDLDPLGHPAAFGASPIELLDNLLPLAVADRLFEVSLLPG